MVIVANTYAGILINFPISDSVQLRIHLPVSFAVECGQVDSYTERLEYNSWVLLFCFLVSNKYWGPERWLSG